jgi:predicted flavoprotein YhiN
VTVTLDLRPDIDAGVLAGRVDGPRGGQSLSNWLRKRATLSPAAIGLVQEALHGGAGGTPLSTLVKALPLRLTAPMPMARAISVAGGVRLDALDDAFMLRGRPGVFAAGEMLDWEAPTGGYLLQASFATGVAAARGALRWLGRDGTMPA